MVLLPAGLSNVSAASDAGPYYVAVVGAGSAKFKLLGRLERRRLVQLRAARLVT